MKPAKVAMWEARRGLCDMCGEWMPPTDMECHIHHGVIPKNRLPKKQQKDIDNPINLTLLHAYPCHMEKAHSDSDWAIDFAIALHGYDAVRDYCQEMLPRTWGSLYSWSPHDSLIADMDEEFGDE